VTCSLQVYKFQSNLRYFVALAVLPVLPLLYYGKYGDFVSVFNLNDAMHGTNACDFSFLFIARTVMAYRKVAQSILA